MNKYNFDEIANRYNTDSSKYSEGNGVLPMWVADMDFKVLPEIEEAIIKRAHIGAYGYSDVPDRYFKAYKDSYYRHHRISFEIDECIYATGIVAAIDSIYKNILHKGDKVLMLTPIYHIFFNCIKNNGLELVEQVIDYDEKSFSIDYKKLENTLKNEEIKAFLLCNPHNPNGYIFSKDELNNIARMCYENDVLLLSDEIHGEIVDPGEIYHSILEVDDKYYKNIIALFAGGKVFNIAGLHSACLVIKNKQLRESVQAGIYHDDIGEPNFFSCDANIAAFNNGDQWIKELNEYLYNNKNYLYSFLKERLPHLKCLPSKATYLLWIDISYYSNDSEKFAKELKEKYGLWISAGSIFKGNGNKFIRINVATSLANVKLAMEKLEKYCKSIKKD